MTQNTMSSINGDNRSKKREGMDYNNFEGYEKEQFDKMKSKFVEIIKLMDAISVALKQADELGIRISKTQCKNYFDFSTFYNSNLNPSNNEYLSIEDLYWKLGRYNYELQQIVTEAKKGKTEELKAAL